MRNIQMIDLKFLRENPEIVRQNIKNKFQEQKLPLVDEVIELDEQSRKAKQEADRSLNGTGQKRRSHGIKRAGTERCHTFS